MATIKSYTDLQQSKKLAEILPLESADMYFIGHQSITNPKEWEYGDTPRVRGKYIDFDDKRIFYPCWSLAALLEQLPYEVCDDDGNSVYLQMNKEDDVYQLAYIDTYGFTENIYTDTHEHFVDACVSMILKLNELNLL